MNNFINTMNSLVETLQALNAVINNEQTLLCSGRVNGVALQHITEQKSSLLTTVDYLDQQRRQHDTAQAQSAPYPQQPEIAEQWKQIVLLSEKLSQINNHNGLLLDKQIAHNSQALSILKTSQTQKLYGPNGQTTIGGQSVRKISV